MKSEQYLANAEHCVRLAKRERHDHRRAVYQNMEACWRALAVTAALCEDGVGFSVLRDGAEGE
jgi:hypothetical protein